MKSGQLLLLVAIIAIPLLFLSQQLSQKDEFTLWKEDFGIVFNPLEDSYRKIIFFNNLRMFALHNADPNHSYKLGKGPFTAMTQSEFELSYLKPKKVDPQQLEQSDIEIPKITQEIDWVANGKVSPVKFMGTCPADWAFTAVASMESLALFKNQSIILSEQQMVDCTATYGNLACDNGETYQAFEYVRDHGIQTAAAYPYIEKREKCQMSGGAFKITAWHSVKGCSAITTAILQRPLCVIVNAVYWQHYNSGIFTECQNKSEPNFVTFLVGVTSDYWKMKNAWGPKWGEDGYIRLAINNPCGICYMKTTWSA